MVVIIQNRLCVASHPLEFYFHATVLAMRSSSYTEKLFVKTMRGARREVAIDSFSQTQASSVWFYRVNVSVYEEVLVSTFIDEDFSDGDDDDARSSLVAMDVEHYSILRRYSDFFQLYEQICAELTGTKIDTLPPFPAKEFISPALRGMLRRESSSKTVLADRSAKFETLLQWIENHPAARNCSAFVKFIGRPPQSDNGYVSLKEYTPSDWLSSLQQTAKGMEDRRRRYSTGSSAGRSQFGRSSSEMTNSLSNFHRQHVELVQERVVRYSM